MIKIIGLIAFIGICQAVEHAYSSQSITRYDSHHEHEQGKHEEPAYEEYKHEDYKYEDYGDNENKYGQKNEHKVDHKFEHKVDHKVEHKVDHKVEHKVSPKIQDEHQFEDYGHIFNNFDDKKHVEHEPEHEVEHKSEHKSEHKVEHIKEHNENNKEESYGHKENEHEVYIKTKPVFEKYEDHKFTAATPIKVVPIAQYVQKDSEDHHNEHHELATSSQHIARHDVPAPPPKGFSDHSGPAKYEFAYEVKDPKTGDHKYQHEARDGHTVKGIYSLHEADGSIRTVEYAADKHAGFSAAVKQTTKHIEEKHHR